MPTNDPAFSDLAEQLKKKLFPIVDAYRAAKADGKVTFWEAMGLIRQVVRQAVDLAELAGSIPGPEKKAAVEAVLLMCFDALWPLVSLSGWAGILRFLPTSVARTLFMAIADQLIEMVVEFLPRRLDPA